MVLIGALLISCGGVDSDNLPLELVGDSQPSTDTDESTEEIPEAYCVTIPTDSSPSLRACGDALAVSIERQTGVRTRCLYEHEISGEEDVFWIYLGWVRSASTSHWEIKDLRRADYRCLRVKNAIVLGGKSDGATEAAVARFCREILPAASASVLMPADGGFSYTASDYEVETVTLNGFDLHEYGLVYPTNDSPSLHSLATALRDEIARRSGYVLAVLSEQEHAAMGKGIFLRVDRELPTVSSAYWIPREDGITLSATDSFGVSVAVDQFCRQLLSRGSADTTCAMTVSTDRAFAYGHQPYRLASLAVRGRLPFDMEGLVSLTDCVFSDAPHAVLCDAPMVEQVRRLSESLTAYAPLTHTEDGTVLAYGAEGVLSLSDTYRIEGASLGATLLWVGDELGGFSVLHISGALSEDRAICLSDWFTPDMTPTVVLIHTEGDGRLFLEDADATKLDAVCAEESVMAGKRSFFSCYAVSEMARVSTEEGSRAEGYRSLTVELVSAFYAQAH